MMTSMLLEPATARPCRGTSRYRTTENIGAKLATPAEMSAVADALDSRDSGAVLAAMSDRWLDDCTLSGYGGASAQRG